MLSVIVEATMCRISEPVELGDEISSYAVEYRSTSHTSFISSIVSIYCRRRLTLIGRNFLPSKWMTRVFSATMHWTNLNGGLVKRRHSCSPSSTRQLSSPGLCTVHYHLDHPRIYVRPKCWPRRRLHRRMVLFIIVIIIVIIYLL